VSTETFVSFGWYTKHIKLLMLVPVSSEVRPVGWFTHIASAAVKLGGCWDWPVRHSAQDPFR